MLRAEVDDLLNELFEHPSDTPLRELRLALSAAYPKLFLQITLDQLFEATRRDVVTRAVGSNASNPPIILDPESVDDPCLSPDDGVSGWFAVHAFRIARVYDEVRLHRESLESNPPAPTLCVRSALRRLNRWFHGNQTLIADALQATFERALSKAGTFDCRFPFCPWFRRLLGNVSEELGSKEAIYEEMTQLHADITVHPLPEAVRPPMTDAERLAEFVNEGIEVTPEFLHLAARESLVRRGISEPPDSVIDREAELFRRYYELLLKTPSANQNEVELNLYELYVGYGHHRDHTRQVPTSDPARAILEEILIGIAELTRQQERCDRGEPRDLAITRRTRMTDTVSLLAWMQEEVWGLLANRTNEDPVWHAADNLRWFSWVLHATALLAMCRRYASRINDPAFAPFLTFLKSGNWLRNIRPSDRAIFGAQVLVVCPEGGLATSDAGAARLLTVSVCIAAEATRNGKRMSRRLLDDVTKELPVSDWNWWVSRVTGRNRVSADERAEQLFNRI